MTISPRTICFAHGGVHRSGHPINLALAIMLAAGCQGAAGRKTLASPDAAPLAAPAIIPAALPINGHLPSMSEVARDLTDKGPNGHNFTDIYDRFLGGWRNDPIRIFEIGVASGGSVRLWNAYFPKGNLFAIDIVDSKQYDNARTKTFIADQANRQQLGKAMAAFGGEFDFILDDGGHRVEQQQISLGFLFKYVKSGGYYIVEDLHTSLTNKYVGGGYGADPDGENTTLRMLERYIHGYPPKFESKYFLPMESAYLEEYVESVVISFRHDGEHSMVAIIRKR